MKRIIPLLLTFTLLLTFGLAQADEDVLRIVAMKGPTGMGMVKLMSEEDPAYTFEIASDITLVTPMVVKGEVDIAAVPANIAAVLYNNPDVDVQVLCVNTLGVLYIVENGDTVHSVEDLAGRTIYGSGAGATPEYALNYILQSAGVDADIEWKSEHTECLAALLNSENGLAMLPQPFVTTALMQNPDLRVALSMTEAWDALQEGVENPSMLLTGVLIVRKEVADAHPEMVNTFMEKYAVSVAWVNDNVDEAAVLVGQYGIVPEAVARQAIPACNIVCIEGDEMISALGGYLSVLYDQNPKAVGGVLPDEGFWYLK
ncbi:MAG: ABC transporter substrate-binding protein [Clostridia bacterium]|nr:ABC transporter substrate-binding protein [Clostridia bacterium]